MITEVAKSELCESIEFGENHVFYKHKINLPENLTSRRGILPLHSSKNPPLSHRFSGGRMLKREKLLNLKYGNRITEVYLLGRFT